MFTIFSVLFEYVVNFNVIGFGINSLNYPPKTFLKLVLHVHGQLPIHFHKDDM